MIQEKPKPLIVKGVDYPYSWQKRALDRGVAAVGGPVVWGATRLLKHSLNGNVDSYSPVFFQNRVGADGHEFPILKLRTLMEDGRPISDLAALFRRLGIDELKQVHNIRGGQMSAVGHRPLAAEIMTAIEDKAPIVPLICWKAVVGDTKPGIVSSFAIAYHDFPLTPENITPEIAEAKLELDKKDVRDGSIPYDIALMVQAGATLVSRVFSAVESGVGDAGRPIETVQGD